jgi:hypothetical protein
MTGLRYLVTTNDSDPIFRASFRYARFIPRRKFFMIRVEKSLINKIIRTHFWQAAFVRPFPSGQENWKTRTGAALAYVYGLFVFIPFSAEILINDYFVNYIPLSEMSTQTGKLVHISYCHRCEHFF